MNIYDHIQELRAELSACADMAERNQIEADLAGAMQELAFAEAELDVWMEEEPS